MNTGIQSVSQSVGKKKQRTCILRTSHTRRKQTHSTRNPATTAHGRRASLLQAYLRSFTTDHHTRKLHHALPLLQYPLGSYVHPPPDPYFHGGQSSLSEAVPGGHFYRHSLFFLRAFDHDQATQRSPPRRSMSGAILHNRKGLRSTIAVSRDIAIRREPEATRRWTFSRG